MKQTYASPRSSNPMPMYAFLPPSPSTRRTKYRDESSTGSTALLVGVYFVRANSSPERAERHQSSSRGQAGKGDRPVFASYRVQTSVTPEPQSSNTREDCAPLIESHISPQSPTPSPVPSTRTPDRSTSKRGTLRSSFSGGLCTLQVPRRFRRGRKEGKR